MKPGTDKAFISSKKGQSKKKRISSGDASESSQDANIFALALSSLGNTLKIEPGYPHFCPACKGILSTTSFQNLKKEGDHTYWTCEFCDNINQIDTVAQLLPTSEPATYLLEEPQVVVNPNMALVSANTLIPQAPILPPGIQAPKEISVVFCIDLNRTMDTSRLVRSGYKNKYARRTGTVSRLEGLKSAIDTQIQKMALETPNVKVGFVTFAQNVEMIGDASQTPKHFLYNDFKDFSSLIEAATNFQKQYMNQSVGSSYKKLLGKLDTIKTGDGSSLGSGLTVSTALASTGAPGSRVIICTDGLAHEGIGQITSGTGSSQGEAKDFYTNIGEFARKNGIMLSLISLADSECRMDILSPIANLTYGDIMKIDLSKVVNNFSRMSSSKVIATSVAVKIKLHKALEFRSNNDGRILSADRSVLALPVGNATKDSQVTFAYGARPLTELKVIKGLDLSIKKSLPFQAQIEFKSLDGRKFLMVMTKMLDITSKLAESIKNPDFNVIRTHALQSTARFACAKSYEEAEKNMSGWRKFAVSPEQIFQFDKLAMPLSKAIKKQKMQSLEYPSEKSQFDELTIEINKANRELIETYRPPELVVPVPHPFMPRMILPPIPPTKHKRQHNESSDEEASQKKKKIEE